MNKWMIAVLTATLSLSAMAQQDELEELPGYVEFGELKSVYGEPKVMINIGGTLLNFMGAASKHDPEAAALLKNLQGVRINVYSTEGQTGPALEQLTKVKNMLQEQDWEPIVQVRETGEEVQIFMKVDGEAMQGLVVMAVDGDEAVFINIIGMIDPSQLAEVMEQFDVAVDL
ncbi:MAG: DUF4252 domain-containing protein [Gammaproteobacteria bacterium]|nr:DUF4252 domain-containing protein [Gammaproteobacteria bacterium]